jgi:hypothetical protein
MVRARILGSCDWLRGLPCRMERWLRVHSR